MSAWNEMLDEASGRNYYYNTETNEVSWEKPAESTATSSWSEVLDESSGNYYYVNSATGETSWDKPAELNNATAASVEAPVAEDVKTEEWVEVADASGAVYYYNPATNETSWEKPASASSESPSEEVAAAASDWVELFDEASGLPYYSNSATGEVQWENPNPEPAPMKGRERFDSNTSAMSDFMSIDGETANLGTTPRESMALNRKRAESTASAKNFTFEANKNSNNSNNNTVAASPTARVSPTVTTSAVSTPTGPGKNLSLFANSNLILPNFNTDSGSKKNNSTTPRSKARAVQDYTTAPDEFLNEYFGNPNPAPTSGGRRRSATSSSIAAAVQGLNLNTTNAAATTTAGAAGAVENLEVSGTDSDEEDVDLTPAQAAALNLFELIEPQATAVKTSEIVLSASLEALKSPYVLSQLSKKLTSFTLDKYAEAHFQYDRRANSNSSTLHASPVDKLITYQSELLKAPLTPMPSAALAADAVACFRIIVAFMSSASKSSGLQQIDLAVNLLLKLITASPEFHDEVYCQLCKQTRKNPSVESLELGWQLMLLCLSTIPPSKRLLPYLVNYIATALNRLESATASANAISSTAINSGTSPLSSPTSAKANPVSHDNALKFIIIALRTVVPAAAATVRTEIPTRAEIRALLLGETLEISVSTMVAGLQHTFNVDSYTTMEVLLTQMCDQLQLSEQNRKIFSLYEYASGADDDPHSHTAGLAHHSSNHSHHSPSHSSGLPSHSSGHSVEVELSPTERVLDWVSRCQRALLYNTGGYQQGSVPYNYNYHLSTSADEHDHHRHSEHFPFSAYSNTSTNSNAVPTNSRKLLIRARYMYRISDHSFDNTTMNLLYAQAHHDVLHARYLHTPADAIVLAAFVLQETLGDYMSGIRSISELKNKTITLYRLVSRRIVEAGNISRNEIELKIFNAHKALIGVSKDTARRMYLSYISCWKVYGGTFFIVSGQVNNFTEIVLSVSANSILLLDPVSMHYLAEYKYGDLYSWGHSFDSFVLIIGSKSSQSKSYFKTTQGKELDSLVQIYHEHYVRTEHSSGSSVLSTSSPAVRNVKTLGASSTNGNNNGSSNGSIAGFATTSSPFSSTQ